MGGTGSTARVECGVMNFQPFQSMREVGDKEGWMGYVMNVKGTFGRMWEFIESLLFLE